MNIFVTHKCPTASAKALDDKRVVKMVLESCQILNTVLIKLNKKGIGYKATHENHPCVLWAAESFENYLWLLDHFDALVNEYYERYSKHHKCGEYYTELLYQSKLATFHAMALTPFVNCTDFKHIEDVHEAYKECLRTKWLNDVRKPTWYGQDCNPNGWDMI
jgi:hypothetical protein